MQVSVQIKVLSQGTVTSVEYKPLRIYERRRSLWAGIEFAKFIEFKAAVPCTTDGLRVRSTSANQEGYLDTTTAIAPTGLSAYAQLTLSFPAVT